MSYCWWNTEGGVQSVEGLKAYSISTQFLLDCFTFTGATETANPLGMLNELLSEIEDKVNYQCSRKIENCWDLTAKCTFF